ncbi:uncharacterized protein EV422DRAFT_229995 [Fimicolochytrium jonesii]|uniref:uncharacterized protein n=1 Tax=Fimicolochytrium jonesii TaxID=1396493 RepID=UPI0022FEE8DA|nr:uncharacterized protein EV422DRAFT_229995 [Fimicolochytrium jonesii]KAI8817278.1 hypothetical protein EV422DRAFT_229995 [Fimicolochytrium jonesii]
MASNTLAPISTSVPALQVQRNGTCCVCLRPVYAMEAVVAQFKFYHKGCLKCAQCNRTLSIANYASHNGSVYCTAHLPKTPQLTTPTGRRNSDDKTFGSLSGFSSTYTTTTAGSDAHQRSASEYAHRPNLRNVFSESSPNTSPLTSTPWPPHHRGPTRIAARERDGRRRRRADCC